MWSPTAPVTWAEIPPRMTAVEDLCFALGGRRPRGPREPKWEEEEEEEEDPTPWGTKVSGG